MMKRSMDVIDIYVWVQKYKSQIESCKIDNIYHNGFYWTFKLRCPGTGKRILKIEPGVRIHFSIIELHTKKIDKLAAFLRKHIRNGSISLIEQLGWERILRLTVRRGDKTYYIYIEIIPRGFFVITNEKNVIIYANRFAELRDRKIRIGEPYSPPPPSKVSLLDIELDTLIERVRKGRDLVRGIVKGLGLPGMVAEEVLFRAGLYHLKNAPPDMLAEKDYEKIMDALNDILEESLKGQGFLVNINGKPYFFSPYRPQLIVSNLDAKLIVYDDFNSVVDHYFGFYEREIIARQRVEREKEEIIRLEKSIEELRNSINKYTEEMHRIELILNRIYENYESLEKILECARRVREKHGWDLIPVKCGVSRVIKDKGFIMVRVNGVDIPLDIRLDIWGNVNMLAKKRGELKGKVSRAEAKLKELESIIREKKIKSIEREKKAEIIIRPRNWFEKYHWLITSNGFLVIGGRDAGQNETIVRKYLEPEDLFLHADIHGGPVTLLKTRGNTPSEKDIREAAVIAACYSRAWREGLGVIDVYWVRGEQVSKKPPSGEYLAKGAFMVYGKKNYVRVELRLALGVEPVCDPIYGLYHRVIIGPEELVRKRSIAYVVLVPGDTRITALSDKIISSLHNASKPYSLGITRSDIEYRLPGPSRIIRVARGLRYGDHECET